MLARLKLKYPLILASIEPQHSSLILGIQINRLTVMLDSQIAKQMRLLP